MFCPQCGKKCPDDARFCEHCGSLIDPAPAPRPAPMPRPAPGPQPAPMPRPAPGPFPPSAPIAPPPMQMRKKSHAGLVAVLLALVLLLAAAGGGVYYLLQLRTANEAALSDNLMDYVWDCCEADIIEYYDEALAEPYSERGYKVEKKASSFSMRPQAEKDTFSVSGSVDIIDRNAGDAVYRVDITGTVKTDLLRRNFTWDLECDFEEPPEREPEDQPEGQPDDKAPEGAGTQEPAPATPQPGDAPAVDPNVVDPGGPLPAEEESGYLWPTDSQYITDADLANFTRKEIMLMRNELYARYGCSFRDEEIRTYFEAQSWYVANPNLLAVDFKREWFNEYETANLDTILNYERAKGWKK